jgi:hypothetical protein
MTIVEVELAVIAILLWNVSAYLKGCSNALWGISDRLKRQFPTSEEQEDFDDLEAE